MLNIASGILLIGVMKNVINANDILIYVILHNFVLIVILWNVIWRIKLL
jgi:hypothetical protein